jgi:hypothetical protein
MGALTAREEVDAYVAAHRRRGDGELFDPQSRMPPP